MSTPDNPQVPSAPTGAPMTAAGPVPGAPPAAIMPAAAAAFGSALGQAERYAALLAGPGVERGVLGPAEASRIWDRHLLNCAAVAELVPSPCSLIDLGSGAGLPGIVLAMLLPDVAVTLLEPMARRVAFLDECVRTLGLANAEVRRGRAEDLAGQLSADVVTARAVAPMYKLADLAIGLVNPGGLVLAIKGAGAAGEISRAMPVLRRLGARDVEVVHAGSGKVSPAATVVRFTAGRVRSQVVRRRAAGQAAVMPAGQRLAAGPGRRRGMPGGRRGRQGSG
ncbi:MAG TPA: 16S rRNA (guanine(527)-N(7))-methyltransferase RsmG [Streptosporangiaceae bacterium]|nr:16S rRNA (guanine(527)-N(7))-methyltransferase RsmG [Streptosporangiaceae bacterium]